MSVHRSAPVPAGGPAPTDGGTSCGPGGWWGHLSPSPWAALVWVPVLLLAPAVELGADGWGWAALLLTAAAAVGALVAAHGAGPRGRSAPRGRPGLLLALQAVGTALTAAALPTGATLWVWVLLGLTTGAAASARWGLWGVGAVTLATALWSWSVLGADGAVGYASTVLASGVATYAFYRLTEVVADLRRTRTALAEAAVREERLRLSRDLHDLLGHSLSLVVVKAEAVRRLGVRDPEAVATHAADIETIGREALGQVRRAVAGYRGDGLAAELARAGAALSAAAVSLEVRAPDPLPPEVAADPTLGWVLREAVTNVVRHAGARRCVVVVTAHSGRATLEVTDDGRGIGGATTTGRAGTSGLGGLAGLRERVSGAGGRLTVGAAPGGGVRVTAEVPLPSADPVGERGGPRADAPPADAPVGAEPRPR